MPERSTIFHKNELFSDAQAAWAAYAKNPRIFDFPERITIELTNRCNLSCFMCPRNTTDMELGNMDISLFRKIVDEASDHLPICLVPFFRGEPLLHPQFLEMLSYARQKGLKPTQLATNAHFLNDEFQKGILELDIDFISFSVDANEPEIYKKIRKNSDFEKVYENIISFLAKRTESQKTSPIVQISAVRTKENTDFMEGFIAFWKPRVDRVRVYTAHSLNGKLGSLQEKRTDGERKPCLKLLTDMVIYWNGDVAVCNHDWNREEFIGNVKSETIADIWLNEQYQNIRMRHLAGKYTEDPTCRDCAHWEFCYEPYCPIGEVYV